MSEEVSKGAVTRISTSTSGKKDLLVKKASASDHLDFSGNDDGVPLVAETGQSTDIQVMILRQLQMVNDRLDKVEKQVTGSGQQQDAN